MVQRCVVLLCLAVYPLSAAAQEQHTLVLDLKQCEKLALENNPLVKEAEMHVQVAQARQSQASHAGILPKLELKNVWGPISRARELFVNGVLTSPDTTFRFSNIRYYTEVELNLLQPIFTFGKISNLNTAARHGVQVEKAGLEGVEQEVLLKVRELYWSHLLAKELLAVTEDAMKEIEKADSRIQEKLDEGSEEVSQTDLFKLQIFNYEIRKRYRQTLDDLELSQAQLRSSLGLQQGVGIVIATEYLDPVETTIEELSVYMDMAFYNRPEVARLRAGLNARKALVNAAKSDYFPQVFLGAQVKYNFAKDRFDSNNPFVHNPTNFFRPGVVFGLNLNLNFLQTRDKVRVEQAEYDVLARKEDLLQAGIKLEVRKAYLDLKRAATNLREGRKALKASENWLRSATMTFDIGVGEVKELIDAFKANGQMQTEYFRNIYKFNLALARLGKAVGRDLYAN